MSHSIDVDISDMDGGSPVVNYGLLFVLQVGLAGYYVAARYAMNVGGVSPWLFGFIRVSGAALVMTVLTRFFFVGNLNIPKEKSMLMKLIALGIIGGTGPMVFASLGLAYTTAINAAIISVTQPVITAAIAISIGMDLFQVFKLAGIFVSIAGCLVMLNINDFSWDGTTAGNLFMLCQCISVAIYNVMTRYLVLQGAVIHWAIVCDYTLVFGTAGMALVSSYYLFQIDLWQAIAPTSWIILLYSIFFAVSLYTGYAWVLKRVAPTIFSSFITLQPLLSGILAMIFLDEHMAATQYLGGVLVILGLLLVVYPMPERWDKWNKLLHFEWFRRRAEEHAAFQKQLQEATTAASATQSASNTNTSANINTELTSEQSPVQTTEQADTVEVFLEEEKQADEHPKL